MLFCPLLSAEITWRAEPKQTFSAGFTVGTASVYLSPTEFYPVALIKDDDWLVEVVIDNNSRLVSVPKASNGLPTGDVLTIEGQSVLSPTREVLLDATKQFALLRAGESYVVLKREDGKVTLRMPTISPVAECAFPEKYFELAMGQSDDAAATGVETANALQAKIGALRAEHASPDIAIAQAPEDYVVIIESDVGAGTGFLMRDGDNVYCYTAFHVIDGMRAPVIRQLSGLKLQPFTLEVANTRDIARMLVAGNPPALAGCRAPKMGESITVCGNSQGRGRVTLLNGSVTGLGDEEVESNAEFTTGNSGSALVADSDGLAVGVASYLEQVLKQDDFAVKGTRFARPRRVSAILDDQIEWVPADLERLASANRKYHELNQFFEESIAVMERIYQAPAKPISMEGISLTSLSRWTNGYNGVIARMSASADKVQSERDLQFFLTEFMADYTRQHESFRRLCQVHEAQIRALRNYPGTEYQQVLNQRLLAEYEALGEMNDAVLAYLRKVYGEAN